MFDGFGYPRWRLREWRALRVLDMTGVGLAFDHIHTGALLNLALRLTTGTSLSFHPKTTNRRFGRLRAEREVGAL